MNYWLGSGLKTFNQSQLLLSRLSSSTPLLVGARNTQLGGARAVCNVFLGVLLVAIVVDGLYLFLGPMISSFTPENGQFM